MGTDCPALPPIQGGKRLIVANTRRTADATLSCERYVLCVVSVRFVLVLFADYNPPLDC